jgi:hypothetical protein
MPFAKDGTVDERKGAGVSAPGYKSVQKKSSPPQRVGKIFF